MHRSAYPTVATLVLLAVSAQAASWIFGDATLIDALGTRPSVWDGSVAYTDGTGGAVMLYDGSVSQNVYGPASASYEPINTGVSVAWRNSTGGPETNEIFSWDGTPPVNVSNSPGVNDLHLAGGSNGDLIWSANETTLMYYDASSGTAFSLGIQGDFPSLYITDTGVATYAYQDPTTDEIKYFDGTSTYSLGPGKPDAGRPSLWDGVVAWCGAGVGSSLNNTELYYWETGFTEPIRLTNDDAVNGIADEFPRVWNGVVVWSRALGGPFQPRLFLYDGDEVIQVNNSCARYPSYHGGYVAWVGTDGLYVATLTPIGPADCNADGVVDLDDFDSFQACHSGPSNGPLEHPCECSDVDGPDDDVDLADFAEFQILCLAHLPPFVPGDCNANGITDFADFETMDYCFTGPENGPAEPGCDCVRLEGSDEDVDLADFAEFQIAYAS